MNSVMKKEKGQPTKIFNSLYCDNAIISGEAFSEYTVKSLCKTMDDRNDNMRSLGVKPVRNKFDFNAVKRIKNGK